MYGIGDALCSPPLYLLPSSPTGYVAQGVWLLGKRADCILRHMLLAR